MSKLLLISHLLLGEKTVRPAEGGTPNSFGKMGGNQWAALCAANEKVGQFSESQILVRGGRFELPRPYGHMPLKHARLPITTPARYYVKSAIVRSA